MRGENDAAISHLSSATRSKLDRKFLAIAYFNRGIAYGRLGRREEARRDYDQAVRLDPELAGAYEARGFEHHLSGEYDKAVNDFNESIRLNPNAAIALVNRGTIYANQGRLDEATADLNEAVRAEPNNPEIFMRRGWAYQLKGDYSAARASIQAAIRIDPQRAASVDQFGLIRSDVLSQNILHQPSPAILDRNLQETLYNRFPKTGTKRSPTPLPLQIFVAQTNAYTLLNQGIAALERHEPEEAIKYLDQALQQQPDFGNRRAILANRGNAYLDLRRWQKARKDYDEAIKLDPRFVEALLSRALVFRAVDDWDSSLQDCNAAIAIDPTYARAYSERAIAYLYRKQVADAAKDCEAALYWQKNVPEIYLVRSRVFCAQGDYQKALGDLNRAVELSRNFETLNARAWFLATCPNNSLRDGATALADATAACELIQGRNGNTVDTLAAAHAETGDFQTAVKHQQQAINLIGDDISNLKGMRQRLELYRQGRPYRDTKE